MNWKKWICAGLTAALCLGLCACQKEEEPSSSQEEESSVVSQEPSPTPEPESSLFIPSEDLLPTPEPGENGEVDLTTFEGAFSQNPVDQAYDADYAYASSFSMMRQACDTAARRWKTVIEATYQADLEVVTDTQANAALRTEQAKWLETSDNRVEIIRRDAEDNNEGILSAAREIVLLYRDRAKELCKVYFEATDRLPDFPDLDAEAVG